MTTCSLAGLALGQSTLTVMSLDENYQQTVTINVKACTSKPDVPTGITFSKETGIKLNEEITATAMPEVTSGGAVPTQYNWTIPTANFEITSGTGTRVITLKAKAASASIKNEIKVNAQNTCGTSADYTNTTELSIYNCTAAPATPGAITIPASVAVNTDFTASITAVSNATGYTWNTPAGLTIVSGQNTTTVTYKASSAGTIVSGAITVTANNACGDSDAQTSASDVIVNPPACPGVVISGGVHTGPTTKAISDGTSYATLISTHFTRDVSKNLCVYYRDGATSVSWNTSKPACEAGTYVDSGDAGVGDWRLPNIAELGYLHDLVRTGNGLKDQPNADARTVNFKATENGYSYPYWSSTEYSSNYAITWRFFPSSGNSDLGTWYYAKTATNADASDGQYSYSARCVRTMN
jgi:hypothetical protein